MELYYTCSLSIQSDAQDAKKKNVASALGGGGDDNVDKEQEEEEKRIKSLMKGMASAGSDEV